VNGRGGRLSLYLDAARGMRARQIAWRARRLVPPRLLAAGTVSRTPPHWRPDAAGIGIDRAPQGGPAPPPDSSGEFTAVGVSRRFGSPDFWTDRSDGQLFLFHLHGFSPLASYAAGPRSAAGNRFWARVVEGWLSLESSPRLPSWHPHPTSIRVISWASALSSIREWPESLRSRLSAELWRQARYMRRSIEHDIGGNHVVKNATALVAAGTVFQRSGLLDSGLGVLRGELSQQILGDGGHEERSTSYHRQVRRDLDDVAELVRRARHSVPPWLDDAITRAASWEAEMTGPDGALPLLNDAWDGPADGTPRSEPVTRLSDSGYVVLRDRGDQAIFDVGPICPPHLPPHAHADVLSFVLWCDERPLVVDPGSYAYTGQWRDRFRGTVAHNTVELDGCDQCHFWGDFRAAHLPRVRAQPLRRHGDVVIAGASHDGYRRLADPVTHDRALVWLPGDGLVVIDLLRCREPHRIRSSLHLAPGAALDGAHRVGPYMVNALGLGPVVRPRDGQCAPYLGTRVRSAVLEDSRAVGPETPFGWSLLRGDAAVSALARDRLTITRGDGSSIDVPLVWS